MSNAVKKPVSRAKRDSPTSRQGLFPSEAEIARRLSVPLDRWRAAAPLYERDGLAKIDPLMGGRYWPAVRAFFDSLYGVGGLGQGASPSQLDGELNLDAL